MAKLAKKMVSIEGVVFKFADGKEIACYVRDLPDAMKERLALHGIAQKVGDAYSGAESVKAAYAVARATWDNLLKGNFNTRLPGAGSVLAEAVARIKNISTDAASELIGDLDDDAKEKLEKHPQVKAMTTIIRGERAAEKLSGMSGDLEI